MPARSLRCSIVQGAAVATVLGLAIAGAVPPRAGAATSSTTPAPYNWVKLAPKESPSARDGAAVAYDGATRQYLLFGGENASFTNQSDTWTWSGSTWTRLLPKTSPGAESGGAMAYDVVTKQMLLFGGETTSGDSSQTWLWTGSTWQRLAPATSPKGLTGDSLAFDPASNQLILFGGIESTAVAADQTWSWTGTTWKLLAPTTSPPGVGLASFAYYPATKQLVLFGGASVKNDGEVPSNVTWDWNGTTWMKEVPTTSPPARFGAALAYDTASDQMILIGGATPTAGGNVATFSGTWTWTGNTWTSRTVTTSPPHRALAMLGFDGATSQFVLFGGSPKPGTDYSDTWLWERQP